MEQMIVPAHLDSDLSRVRQINQGNQCQWQSKRLLYSTRCACSRARGSSWITAQMMTMAMRCGAQTARCGLMDPLSGRITRLVRCIRSMSGRLSLAPKSGMNGKLSRQCAGGQDTSHAPSVGTDSRAPMARHESGTVGGTDVTLCCFCGLPGLLFGCQIHLFIAAAGGVAPPCRHKTHAHHVAFHRRPWAYAYGMSEISKQPCGEFRNNFACCPCHSDLRFPPPTDTDISDRWSSWYQCS